MARIFAFTMVFALIIGFAGAQTAYANDMIGNSVTGIVTGDILQTASDGGSAVVNVGVIEVGDNGAAIGNNVYGMVNGDIRIDAQGRDVTLNVGVVKLGR